MLIHVTRFTNIQSKVRTQINREIQFLQNRLCIGDGNSPEQLLIDLEKIWNEDFVKTTEAIIDIDTQIISWEDIRTHLVTAAEKIVVKTINGEIKDVLNYDDYPNGLTVIEQGTSIFVDYIQQMT
jgi:hypothetical protein